jgi:dihydrolipoamide dehydrogenase
MPGFTFDETVISSKEAMILPEQPKSLIVIGAGAANWRRVCLFLQRFRNEGDGGRNAPNLLPVEDTEVSQALEKSRKTGIKL